MKVDWRAIKKRTMCTEEQAKLLADEIRKLPKLKDQIMNHLDNVNLFNCRSVELVRMFRYRDDMVKIVGRRKNDRLSFTMCGEECIVENLYCYTFDTCFEDEVFYEII